jgi:hypothetical protein
MIRSCLVAHGPSRRDWYSIFEPDSDRALSQGSPDQEPELVARVIPDDSGSGVLPDVGDMRATRPHGLAPLDRP